MICVFILWREHPKAHRKWFYGEAGKRTCYPWFTRHSAYPLHHGLIPKTFCGFPWVETSTAGRVYDLCVYYMTGAPKGSPKVVLCGFMVLWRSRESNLRPLVYKA